MWTIVRFALADASARAAELAFEILRGAGFQPHPGGRGAGDGTDCGSHAAVGNAWQEPAVVTRAVFEALYEARLRPVFVTCACVVEDARALGTKASPYA